MGSLEAGSGLARTEPRRQHASDAEQVEREAELVVGRLAGELGAPVDVLDHKHPALELEIGAESALDEGVRARVVVRADAEGEVLRDLRNNAPLEEVHGDLLKKQKTQIVRTQDLNPIQNEQHPAIETRPDN